MRRKFYLEKVKIMFINFVPSNIGVTQFMTSCHVSDTIICSLREEPVKLSIENPRQRFWLTFRLLLETICGLIIKIPLIRTKTTLPWDLN